MSKSIAKIRGNVFDLKGLSDFLKNGLHSSPVTSYTEDSQNPIETASPRGYEDHNFTLVARSVTPQLA